MIFPFDILAATARRQEQQFSMKSLLLPTAPSDSIALHLPWGQTRNFLVPAADPRNPKFQLRPKRKPEAGEVRKVISLDQVRYSTV